MVIIEAPAYDLFVKSAVLTNLFHIHLHLRLLLWVKILHLQGLPLTLWLPFVTLVASCQAKVDSLVPVNVTA